MVPMRLINKLAGYELIFILIFYSHVDLSSFIYLFTLLSYTYAPYHRAIIVAFFSLLRLSSHK